MHLAYVAGFEHTWSTESHVASDAETLGHSVTRITATAPHDIEDQAQGADVVICQRTGLAAETEAVWRRLEAAGTRSCSYHLDLFAGLKRERQIGNDPFWWTQTVFTADGDPATTAKLAGLGINHRWLPAAVVSTETGPGEWRGEYDHDIVFVGARNYHPEWRWRAEMLGFLTRRYGDRFRVFDHHPPTRDRDLNDLYATARVVVGDSLALPDHRDFWSDRYYETVGRGGFLIAPWVPGIDAHFTDLEHLVYYKMGDPDWLCTLIDFYLDHPDEAKLIAKQGNAHVAEHHTYRNRVTELLDAL